MPGTAHEEAVEIVKGHMLYEFKITDKDFGDLTRRFHNLIPDISFLNPDTGKYVVIEIGTTNAEKLHKYLCVKAIGEIRWYTRKGKQRIHLVAQWFPETLYHVRISSKSCKVLRAERMLEKRLSHNEKMLMGYKIYPESYTACMGCGQPTQIRHLMSAVSHGRDYLVCESCHRKGRFVTCGELQNAIASCFVQ